MGPNFSKNDYNFTTSFHTSHEFDKCRLHIIVSRLKRLFDNLVTYINIILCSARRSAFSSANLANSNRSSVDETIHAYMLSIMLVCV